MYVTRGMEGVHVIQNVYTCVQGERGINGIILQYNSGLMAATLKKSSFQYVSSNLQCVLVYDAIF